MACGTHPARSNKKKVKRSDKTSTFEVSLFGLSRLPIIMAMRSALAPQQARMEGIDTSDFPDDFLNVFHNTMQKVNSISEFKDILTSPSLHSIQNPTLTGPQSQSTGSQVSKVVEPKRTTSALDLDGLGSLRPNTSFLNGAEMGSLQAANPSARDRAHSLTIDADAGFLGSLPTSYSSNGITFTNSNFDTNVFPDCEPVYEEEDERNFAAQNFYASHRNDDATTAAYNNQYYGDDRPNNDQYGEEESYEGEESTNANGKRNRKPSAKKMENGYDRRAQAPHGVKQAVEYQQQVYPPPIKISEESLAVFNPLAASMTSRPGFRRPFKRTLLAPPPPHLTPAHVAALTSTNWVTACQAANSNGNVVKDAVARSTGKVPEEGGEGKRRRMNLSAEDRAKQNRDRNREHARNTRLRKKAYVEELKRTLTEMVHQRESEYRNEIISKQRTEKAKEIRLQVLTAFMNFRGANNQDPNAYACIIEPGFTMTIPQTPYRQFVKPSADKQAQQASHNADQQSVPAHPHNQTFESIEEVMQDSSYLFNMLQSLKSKAAVNGGAAAPSALVFHPILNTVSMEDELLNCQFNTISTNCRQNGAADELRIFGHVQAEFDMESNKLTKLNLMFDTFSVAYQLSSLTPLTVVDNSCPSSPVAKNAGKGKEGAGGKGVEQDKLLMIHHQDNNRFLGVLSNPIERPPMTLSGIKTDEQKKFEKKQQQQQQGYQQQYMQQQQQQQQAEAAFYRGTAPVHATMPPKAQQQPMSAAVVNNNISDSDSADGSDCSGKEEALSATTRRSGRSTRTRAR
ncbi:hypothetical protein TrST_g1086 [Triparma strigata]|uniref:BZIP domain-containing protein n=1 Tax=Triparma strigata TaxID=1606541 RepID=A0A9W7C0E9_9STRA|nr:hypothetical protein TrST_g1086 [Triparma strigata]